VIKTLGEQMRTRVLAMACLLLMLFTSCKNTINESIRVADGETIGGDMNSVNGEIIVGKNCRVRGIARTVNGGISVGSESRISGLQSVNGTIVVDKDAIISADIGSVNGSVLCAEGTTIAGEISTVNGAVTLQAVVVGENIKTANGEILLTSGARVKGDIVVDADPDQFDGSEEQKVLIIRIEQNSVVEGDIIVKRHYRPVEVHLSDEGRVLGQIEGAKLVGRPSI
jgi:hypothetical protein